MFSLTDIHGSQMATILTPKILSRVKTVEPSKNPVEDKYAKSLVISLNASPSDSKRFNY